MLNVFNLLEWRFDLLILAQSRQSGAFVNPRMATPDQGFIESGNETQAQRQGVSSPPYADEKGGDFALLDRSMFGKGR